MSLESDLFLKKKPIISKLEKYGFIKEDNVYSSRKSFMNDDFYCVITISGNALEGKVYDSFDEEYTLVHRTHMTGAFSSKVREEYIAILEDIARNCFEETRFMSDQTMRIVELIKQQYGVEPEYPWSNNKRVSSDACVLRHADSKKWFTIIMNVDRSKVTTGGGLVEVMNFKVGEDKVYALKEETGIYECYHMSKKNWVSVILDDTLSDKRIMELCALSFELTKGTPLRKGKKEWIIPANTSYFNVEEYFDNSEVVKWKQSGDIRVGDIVYVYLSSPYSCILYRCEVIETNIPFDYEDEHVKMTKEMKIRRLTKYEKGLYSFSFLKEHGVKAVRGPRSMPQEISERINK